MRRSNLMNIDWKLPRYIDAKNFCRRQLFPDKCFIIEIEWIQNLQNKIERLV